MSFGVMFVPIVGDPFWAVIDLSPASPAMMGGPRISARIFVKCNNDEDAWVVANLMNKGLEVDDL